MSKLVWDSVGERFYETGVSKGVLFVQNSDGTYATGVAWNGLTAVNQSANGGESNPQWADNIKYLNLRSREDFQGTIEAFTYPDEFEACDGSLALVSGVYAGQQNRKSFGFAYRTEIGNDVDGDNHAYKIHLVYGATVSPSEKNYTTINDSPEPITFSWEFETVPVEVTTKVDGKAVKPVAHIVIDSRDFTTTAAQEALTAFEEKLYGRDADTEHSISALTPTLPDPDTVITDLTVSG